MRTAALSGVWSVTLDNGKTYNMRLPGTLDENNIGYRDALDASLREYEETAGDPLNRLLDEEGLIDAEEVQEREIITTRFTRKYKYEGVASISRYLSFTETPGKRYFIDVERARFLTLKINGREVPFYEAPSLSAPYSFEVTGLINGANEVTFESDNRYLGLPRNEILASNAASDETVTNWNGLLGYIRLREEPEAFAEYVFLRPKAKTLSLYVEIAGVPATDAVIRFESPVLTESYVKEVRLTKEHNGFLFEGLKMTGGLKYWDEDEGHTYPFTVFVNGEKKTVNFGIRKVSRTKRGRIQLNGRTVFLRGNTCFAAFPETGYPPMTVEAWTEILKKYRSYGANFVRFASHCPPEAAFTAADNLGILLMPELSLKANAKAYTSEKAQNYYRFELARILKTYANHPSFVMLSLGDVRSYTEEAEDFTATLLSYARDFDNTRLYTAGTGVFHPESDFLMMDSPVSLKEVKVPIIRLNGASHETLLDFGEISLFSGQLLPANLTAYQEQVEAAGLQGAWERLTAMSGEIALNRYKEDTEKWMLNDDYSGMTVFALSDYPGEGRKNVGMMNTLLQPKAYPFSDPRRFYGFFGPVNVLAELRKRVYEYGEEMQVRFYLANYGKVTMEQPMTYRLCGGPVEVSETLPKKACLPGTLTLLGSRRIRLSKEGLYAEELDEKQVLNLSLELKMGEVVNRYPLFVYPAVIPLCPEDIYESDRLDKGALEALSEGRKVLISTKGRRVDPHAFLSIDQHHPLFLHFSTAEKEDERWNAMAAGGGLPLHRKYRPIITVVSKVLSDYRTVQAFECRVLAGSLFVSAMNLGEMKKYPEGRALLKGIYDYMDSFDFSPAQEMRPEELQSIFKAEGEQ